MPPASGTSAPRVLIYLLRRDLRIADNPVFHDVSRAFAPSSAASSKSGTETAGTKSRNPVKLPSFSHLLPIYVFPANQVEVSGFIPNGNASSSPYPQARSAVGGFWRCGPHRARFVAESVWDVKESLQKLGSDLTIRVGMLGDVLEQVIESYQKTSATDTESEGKAEVVGICMTKDVGLEEKQEEERARELAKQHGLSFCLWNDEKYFIDSQDLPFTKLSEVPDVFTALRKQVEPLRDGPRPVLPSPEFLPPLPPSIPPQADPFSIPDSLDQLHSNLLEPLQAGLGLAEPPQKPITAVNGHPFSGGSTTGHVRVEHLINTAAMADYSDTRNGLLGVDYSTKLSAWLALGCISARQVHWAMYDYEEGKGSVGAKTKGYGKGENKGTRSVRFELLWRDFMRLSAEKAGKGLFSVDGPPKYGNRVRHEGNWAYLEPNYKFSNKEREPASDDVAGGGETSVGYRLSRFLNGTTGTALIDASQRELFHTGYTSNRARQNVASFLAKHMGLDWRLGAEWYEMTLADYDVASNWGNWQYVAGVGNDPRQERVFNPIKQAFDYDPEAKYVKAWLPELEKIEVPKTGRDRQLALMGVFQPWKMSEDDKERLKLRAVDWVENPMIKFNFDPAQSGRNRKKKGGNVPSGAPTGPAAMARGGGQGGNAARGGRGGRGGRKAGERTWRRNGQVDRAEAAQ